MSNTATAFLYLLICGICVYLTNNIPVNAFVGSPSYDDKKKSLLTFLFPILIFTLFWGLRYGVGTDYFHYKDLYESADVFSESHGQAGYELGYLMTNRLFQIFNFSYLSIFIYTSFVFIFSVYFYCRQETRLYTLFAIFFFMTGPVLFAQNGTRQMLSISFFLIGIVFLGKKQLVPFLIFAAIGYFNHRSIVVPIVIITLLYFIKPLHINKYLLVGLNIALFLFGHNLQELFIYRFEDVAVLLTYGDYVSGALERVNTDLVYNTGIGRILLVIVNSVIFLSQELFLTRKKDIRYYMYWCFIIGANLTPLFWGNETLGRISISFTNLAWGSYALAATSLSKKKEAFSQVIVIGLIAWSILSFIISVEANSSGCGSYHMVDLF